MNKLTNPDWLKNKVKIFSAAKDLYIGLSGGVDSVVLLHLLLQLTEQHNITAVHINHGLNECADDWETFCIKFCRELGIECQIFKVNVNSDSNIEEFARNARLEIWDKLLNKEGSVVLAHHMQDQVETVLYRLFRGAGVKGLSAMNEVSSLNNGSIIRPLLDTSKDEITAYAKENNLNWIEDSSNNNERFDRNFIRHKVLPLLEGRWPKVVNKIYNTSEICKENSKFINDHVDLIYANFSGSRKKTLSIKKILEENSFVRFEIIRKFASSCGVKSPSLTHLEKIHKEIMQARIDANPVLKVGNAYFTRYRDDLYLLDSCPQKSNKYQYSCEWNMLSSLEIPDRKLVIIVDENIKNLRDKIENTVTVQLGGIYGKKPRKIFQSLGVPIWERANYPLIYLKGELLAILGLWYI